MRIIVLFIMYYGIAFYGFLNPFWGLLFLIHITIFRPESLTWGTASFGRLHLITASCVLLGYLFLREKGSSSTGHQTTNIFLFLCFLIWLAIVSILAEASVESSLDKTIEVGKIFVTCFLFARLSNTPAQFNLYVWIVVISFGLLSFWGFLQGLAGNPRLDTLWPGGSNYIAAQLALIAPFVLAKAVDNGLSWHYKVLALVCSTSIVLCCIYTGSRGGFLGLCLGIFLFILTIRRRTAAMISLFLIAMLVVPWIPQMYSDRVTSVFAERERRDDSAKVRYVTWALAIHIWQDHPIAGVGLGNFSSMRSAYVDKVRDVVPSQEVYDIVFTRERLPHGLYQGMMAETGLVGTGLFLLFFFYNTLCGFPSQFTKSETQQSLYLQVRGAQAGLVGFAGAAFFGDFQYIESFYWQLFFVGAIREYADSLPMQAIVSQTGTPVTQQSLGEVKPAPVG